MKPAPHRQGGTGDRENSSSTARVIEPTASVHQRTARSRLADPTEVAWARAETRAYLIAVGEIADPIGYFVDFAKDIARQVTRRVLDLHNAVDALYECAFHSGLVDEFGDDQIQRLLSQAFARPRRRRAAA